MEAVWRYFKVRLRYVCIPAYAHRCKLRPTFILQLSTLQVQLPGYLKSIPLPKSLAGFSALDRAEWLELLPFFIFLLVLLYLIFSPFLNFVSRPKLPRPKINKKIRKDEPKVADTFDIEDLGEKVCLCRCWKSAKVSDRSHSHGCIVIILGSLL